MLYYLLDAFFISVYTYSTAESLLKCDLIFTKLIVSFKTDYLRQGLSHKLESGVLFTQAECYLDVGMLARSRFKPPEALGVY